MHFRLKFVDEVISMICCNIFPNGVIIFSRDRSCKDYWHERRHFLIGSVSTLATIFVHSRTASSSLRRLSGRTPACTSSASQLAMLIQPRESANPFLWILSSRPQSAICQTDAAYSKWGTTILLYSFIMLTGLIFSVLPTIIKDPRAVEIPGHSDIISMSVSSRTCFISVNCVTFRRHRRPETAVVSFRKINLNMALSLQSSCSKGLSYVLLSNR